MNNSDTMAHANRWIGGFWHRLGAFAADTLILGFLGFLLGVIFKGYFVQLGEWGRLLGFGIAIVYFGTMDSKICGGQTIGKRILGLRVVSPHNHQPVSILRAAWRTALFCVPFYFNGLQFAPDITNDYMAASLSAIVLGGMLAILYLCIFNISTRQSLHDLIASTYVVHAAKEAEPPGRVWPGHFLIAALLVLLAAGAPKMASQYMPVESSHAARDAQNTLEAISMVREAVITTAPTSAQGTGVSDILRVEVFVTDKSAGDKQFANSLLDVLLQHYPPVKDAAGVHIILAIGYDIGVWSQWTSESYHFEPEDYAADVQQPRKD